MNIYRTVTWQTHGRISPGARDTNMDETLSWSSSQSSEGCRELEGWVQPSKEIKYHRVTILVQCREGCDDRIFEKQ